MRHGIGGSRGRPLPPFRPVRMALMNICSVQLPMPVARSGVRFVVIERPQGPAPAVLVPVIAVSNGAGSLGRGVTLMVSVFPGNWRVIVVLPDLNDVWHPLQS